MQAPEVSHETVRRLAETRPPGGEPVVSAYLNLEPSEFAIAPARATAARSLMDEAQRRAKGRDDLDHHTRESLKADLARVQETLEGDLPAEGARAVAVFACDAAGLYEVFRLPQAVDSTVVINSSAFVEPLASLHGAERTWAVLLVNRRSARVLRGGAAHLHEIERFEDDIRGQHDQGGLEQDRRQRHIEHEVDQHLRRVAGALRHQRFDRLLIGCPGELSGRLQDALDNPTRARVAGRVDVDVEHSNADTVLRAARPLMEADDEGREREALDRLKQGIATDGRGAAGLAETLEALSEQRVEILLIEGGFGAEGVRCPACGWLGVDAGECPADGTPLDRLDDVVDDAVERALGQSADIFVVRHFEDLRPLGRVGAVLRF